jgi:ATPase family associated with various cellular activities (AAA)
MSQTNASSFPYAVDLENFSANQLDHLRRGEELSNQLSLVVRRALGLEKGMVETKRHAYIFSPPGAGKTFTVQAIADSHDIDLVKLHGAASMNAFVTHVACAVHVAAGAEIVVWIDDCDSLFMDTDALNVMKGALDPERNVIAWGKNMTSQINTYANSTSAFDVHRSEALRAFQTTGSPGIEIPTYNVRFVVTSNLRLTPPSGKLSTAKKMHEAAIRDRVNYVGFELSDDEGWGWVAHVTLANEMLGLTKAQKCELLLWMHQNLASLPSRSMRQVRDYAAEMINSPADYRVNWRASLLGGAER